MRVLHVAAELLPIVRTGGLGDVLAALPMAERAAGIDARVLLPFYPAFRPVFEPDAAIEIADPPYGEPVRIVAGSIGGHAPPLYLIEAPSFYDRPGNPYLGPDGRDWPDNDLRFGLLGRIGARLASGRVDPAWRADILHAHDWHAGLAPTWLGLDATADKPPASVFTVHNLAFQGLFPADTVARLGLPAGRFVPSGFEFWDQLSFMKAGLVDADRVTTVSPGYAREIGTPEFGCGLDGVIRDRGAAVSGILNGVDDAVWDPAHDPGLAVRYDADRLDDRAANRRTLLDACALAPDVGPVCGVVSRLTGQKGLDLLLACLPRWLDRGGALVLLGAGDADLEAGFAAAAAAHPSRVAVRIGYDDGFAHRIMAGADLLAVPSRFEPCGLTQLYALRYGAVPVVRRTGGLGDTVEDGVTGFVFDAASADSLGAALDRASVAFARPATWRSLQRAGMRRRFPWSDAAVAYRTLYDAVSFAPSARP